VSSNRPAIDPAHFEPLGSWSSEKLNASRRDNPFMMTWVPGKARDQVPNITHGKSFFFLIVLSLKMLFGVSRGSLVFVLKQQATVSTYTTIKESNISTGHHKQSARIWDILCPMLSLMLLLIK
jgi:hypothetical protein